MHEVINKLKLLNIKEVFFGASGFNIVDESSINKLQLGYSIDPDGNDLTGMNEGDWQDSWVVIGTDTEVGDPFFVDISELSLPVYTAMHGNEYWEPELVATSLTSFLELLSYLHGLSEQNCPQITPDESTISDFNKLSSIQTRLQNISGEDDFWEDFIEQHKEWLEE
ncbi:hypothetical protein C3B51_07365 [Pseudoalteromonas rubra]|uniref:SMI1/KNR4 family protein n=1 Tax=Pseudoalteromonas rubra TaxID=43658 RepID=A0A4Q7EHN4_9GAMM|nr:hypothetical protein [Pseudoalteromonas rubra]RZM83434.1 hypothetical protein C3B51_07365 [Pseudoalteromonas rubra]